MHAARQDVAILRRALDTEIRGLFDTQLAAGFAGLSASLGYGALLDQLLGVKLKKGEGFTKWDRRPLTPQQLRYARDDVAHLIQLADAIKDRLAENGRLEWVREECRPLEEATDERDAREVWRRLPRVNQLGGDARAVAREVAAWREAGRPARRTSPRRRSSPTRPSSRSRARPAQRRQAARHPRPLPEGDQALGRRDRRRRAARREGGAAAEGGRAAAFSTAADAPVIALCEALVRARALEAGARV